MAGRDPRNLILTGFSTTGKSTVGQLVAARLGFPFRDLDHEIEQRAGCPITAIFARQGEAHFRELESSLLQEALAGERQVIATGGGAVLREANRAAMRRHGLVICLEAQPETIVARLSTQAGVRPLLADGDPLSRVRALKAERAAYYAEADWTIHTDLLTPEAVAAEVVRAWATVRPRLAGERVGELLPAAVVTTGSGSYPLFVGDGLLAALGRLIRQQVGEGAVWVVADAGAAEVHGERLLQALREAGLRVGVRVLAGGEASKDLAVASTLYRWLARERAERGDTLVAFGGGVVGDLAGFVAATYLRGIALVQVPTTLLAMTDSAIGGKTGVNLPEGKNLVGAFHQPRLVLADVALLASLPEREYRAGWAETIKHAFIQDPALLGDLEGAVAAVLAQRREYLVDLISRSMAVKARVVSRDEREDGLRMVLNYGHTIGHALEAAGEYRLLLHGEAVAIGMTAAARIGVALGVTPPELEARQRELIARFGLPLRAPAVPLERALAALAVDKKVRTRRNRWVLLADVGQPVIRDDVPPMLAEQVLREVVG
jgi:shikimate kinase/3-dehydroquinate synthase